VPIFLQSGHPGFASSREILGFGLNASATGAIMGIDNFAAILILPMIGIWSDRIRTPIGRRYPFILTAAPLAALAFIVMPIAASLIKPELNGDIGGNIADCRRVGHKATHTRLHCVRNTHLGRPFRDPETYVGNCRDRLRQD